MSIVTTEVVSIHGSAGQQRLVFYRGQDSDGTWHDYGPVITNDPEFDADAYKATISERLERMLAEQEALDLLERG